MARKVKIADLAHNMDVTRLPELGSRDLERLGRYHAAWALLKGPRR